MISIEKLLTGPLGVNTYIVYREGERSCVLIDPAELKKVKKRLDELSLKCEAILLTHGHFDHIMGVAALKNEYGARVYIHKNDAAALYDDKINLSVMAGTHVEPSKADVLLEGGEKLKLAAMEFDVISTPGHTSGGVSYILDEERIVFSGDTLFRLSVGRCDLPGGDEETLLHSIVYKLFELKGNYKVLPGHIRETTLDFERENNPYTRRWG